MELENSLLFATIVFTMILAAGYSNAGEFKNFGVEKQRIKIEINSQLELFHIMAYLANSNYLNNLDFKYKSDINTFFASFKNDHSVQFVNKVLQNYHAHLSINGLFFDRNFESDTSFMKFLQLDSFGLPNTLVNKSMIIDSLEILFKGFVN